MVSMCVSDIHNDIENTYKILQIVSERKIDKLFIAGDIGLDSIRILNSISNKIFAVKGNCDFLSYQKEAKFSLDNINYSYIDKKLVVLTHGDKYDYYSYISNYGDNFDIFISGHTHCSLLKKNYKHIILNPGSLTYPRDNFSSYILIDDREIKLMDFIKGKLIEKITF